MLPPRALSSTLAPRHPTSDTMVPHLSSSLSFALPQTSSLHCGLLRAGVLCARPTGDQPTQTKPKKWPLFFLHLFFLLFFCSESRCGGSGGRGPMARRGDGHGGANLRRHQQARRGQRRELKGGARQGQDRGRDRSAAEPSRKSAHRQGKPSRGTKQKEVGSKWDHRGRQ